MIQIWQKTAKGDILISIQNSIENAEYFCKKNRIKNVEFVKVIE